LTGTHQGDFKGVVPTGKAIEVRGVQIGRFQDGKITNVGEAPTSSKRFGVAQPSPYKHVTGLEGLHRLLAVKVTREVADTLRRAGTGKAGPDALRAIAKAYCDYAKDHPGCYAYLVRAPASGDDDLEEAATEILSVLDAVFAGYGIGGDDAVDAARFLRSTLHGFVSLKLGGGFAMPRPVDQSFERLVTASDQALARW